MDIIGGVLMGVEGIKPILNPADNMEPEPIHIKPTGFGLELMMSRPLPPVNVFFNSGMRCHYGPPLGYVEGEYWYEVGGDDDAEHLR